MARILFSFLIISFLLPVAGAPADGPRTLVFTHSKNYPPYSFADPNGVPKGIFIDFWTFWARKNGAQIRFVLDDWYRCLKMIATGEADVLAGAFLSPDRKKFLDFSQPFIRVKSCVFLSTKLKLKRIEEMKGLEVGIPRDTVAGEYIRSHYPFIQLKQFPDMQDVFSSVGRKEILAFVSPYEIATHYLSRQNATGEFQVLHVLYEELGRAAVKKGRADLIQLIDGGLDRVSTREAEGVFKKWIPYHPAIPEWLKKLLPIGAGGILVLFLVIHLVVLRLRVKQRTAALSQALEQIRSQKAEIELARERAEKASRVKGEFLANVSHELRTPLQTILGAAHLVQHGKEGGKEKEYLEMIRNSGRSLLSLVNELLDLSRIEAGRVELEETVFDLVDLVGGVMGPLSIEAGKKGIEMKTSIQPGVPRLVRGDAKRLGQILVNLVGNAVKFTKEGEVEVSAAAQTGEGLALALQFSVRDTGLGIPVEQQEKIFESFTRVDGSTSRNYGGTGLGLAIVQGLIKTMGGKIGVESEPGAGSTFFFTVPMKAAGSTEMPRSAGPSSAGPKLPGPSLRILLADDHIFNRRILAETLETNGHKVTLAESGQAVLDLWEKQKFDLILLDVQMPGMSGLEAAAEIRRREREKGEHTPILAVTAGAFPEERERCRQAGMDGCIAKPVGFQELQEIIAGLFGDRRPPGPKQDDPAADDGLLDLSGVPELAGHPEKVAKFSRLLVEDLAQALARLEEAFRSRDSGEVARRAHGLKGLTGYLKDKDPLQFTQELEKLVSEGCWEAGADKIGFIRDRLSRLAPLLNPSGKGPA